MRTRAVSLLSDECTGDARARGALLRAVLARRALRAVRAASRPLLVLCAAPERTSTDCGSGKYSVTVAVVVEGACLSCFLYSSSSVDRTSCLCVVGYTGSASCTACAAGKYKPVSGAGACTDCGDGKFSVTEAARFESVCLACPGVSTSTSNRTACQCNAGYTGSACTACSAGKYKHVTGSDACTDCGDGKFSVTGKSCSKDKKWVIYNSTKLY
jgi:hypothetical protein